mmetsp:Transcript_48145/g.79805  ORF Transcript_48145/g.79805 Transcript_48145/m.79805 type:complete len:389 (-) Transcript_48145:39-1205(-)
MKRSTWKALSHLCNTRKHSCVISHHHRSFSILQQQQTPSSSDIVEPSTSTAPSPSVDDTRKLTGDEQHIEVHAFRSLITIAPEPDNINLNDLSLSFTERKAAQHLQRLRQHRQQQHDTKTISSSTDASADDDQCMSGWSPAIAYDIWHSPPEVYDKIYGFEADCEPPDRHNISWRWLYKLWGYYSEREVRYRCALYAYMKAQRRCMNEAFWVTFELENTFRVELQLLCLHVWMAKVRMMQGWGVHRGHKLCYKTFKVFFDQLPNRFGQHLSGSKSRWQQDCQQACLHFAVSLDHAKEDYESGGDRQAFAKVVWNELYLSNRDMQHDLLSLWTEYIVQELYHLEHDISNDEFINGWWRFGSIPSVQDRARVREQIIEEFEKIETDKDAT